MSDDESIRWLRSRSEERQRRHRRGWMLVLALGGLVSIGAALVASLGPAAESASRAEILDPAGPR